jgi:SsrA-binding protein
MNVKTGRKIVASNRKARHEYEIEETFEAGIALTGTEIKSIRAGQVNLTDAYARVDREELWLHQMHIAPYEFGNRFNVEARRSRKLLMHKQEIKRLLGKTQQKGLTLIPLAVYLRNGYAKIELGLGRGKKLYDKREAIEKREMEREAERVLSSRG